jgi:hypothetical protein
MNDQKQSAAAEWKHHWPLVLAGTMGFSFHSVMTTVSGLFMGPLGKDLHMSRAVGRLFPLTVFWRVD